MVEAAGKHADAPLLPNDEGKEWHRDEPLEPMRIAAYKAKLPKGTTLYTSRHTHISQALLNNLNLQLLAENCGASIRMIEQSYGKFLAASRQHLIEQSGFKLGIAAGNARPMKTAR